MSDASRVSTFRSSWSLDPSVTFLNHGSFGACPIPVLEKQSEFRARLEREPVHFLVRELEPLLDAARAALGAFVGADPDDLAFVHSATTGVNTVLKAVAMSFNPGDELLTTDHAYNACRIALDDIAALRGARVTVAKIPFPVRDSAQVFDAIMGAVTPRTKFAMIDHVTSPTALIFPVERLVPALAARGVKTLVDGAHVPGMLDLDVRALGAAFYVGNCHKWLCSPKGAAFLHVQRDLQPGFRPLLLSHGATVARADRSRFRLEFDWMGTDDPTSFLCVPESINFIGGLVPGGWTEIRARNRAAALEAQGILCRALKIAPPAPADMLGSMAAVPLPDGEGSHLFGGSDPLHMALFEKHRIEVPVFPWPAPPKRLLRVAMPIYATIPEVTRLAAVLEGGAN